MRRPVTTRLRVIRAYLPAHPEASTRVGHEDQDAQDDPCQWLARRWERSVVLW
jgi:hypothetical protein